MHARYFYVIRHFANLLFQKSYTFDYVSEGGVPNKARLENFMTKVLKKDKLCDQQHIVSFSVNVLEVEIYQLKLVKKASQCNVMGYYFNCYI